MRFIVLLVLSLCVSGPVLAQTLDDARNAYRAGDYATTLAIASPMAAAGDPDAQNIMGVLYRFGYAVPANPPLAQQYFEAAVAGNVSAAMFNLGDLLNDGAPGVPANVARAEQLYNQAIALDGNAGAMNNLAVLLEDRGNTDWARVVQLYSGAMAGGDRDASVNLALLHFHGRGVPENPVEARRLVDAEVAQTGFGRAERLLAYFFEAGIGGPQDTGRAIALYQAAAADGQASAATDLGIMYQNGAPGLVPDLAQAAAWYRRASDMGDGDGANELGLMMIDGDPTVPDSIFSANEMFRLAHDRGLAHGSRNLAISYWNGDGLGVDFAEARRLMEIAAAGDLADAISDVGVMMEDGVGGPVDVLGARDAYRRAAELGLALGGMNLSGNLMNPANPSVDALEGYAWCLWAIERADADDVAGYRDTCATRSEGWPQDKRSVAATRAQALLAAY
jgi:hypothetical protein